MTRRRRDFVQDYKAWAEQSSATRRWLRSPAGGDHPLRFRGSAKALPRLGLYALALLVIATIVEKLFR
jgi:hypothetical protein